MVIENIDVVDVANGKLVKNQDVVIKGQFIYYIGNSFLESIDSNAKRIDGAGKFLCPGLWDMHFHLSWEKGNDTLLYPALFKNGIIGIRDMGGDLEIMNCFKSSSIENKPWLFGAGPLIDGNPPIYRDYSLSLDDSSDIPSLLDSLKSNGSDFFKTYSAIKENQLKEISDYCRLNNMHFAGHLSEYVAPEKSILLGQKSVEHLNRLYEMWNENNSEFEKLVDLIIDKQTYVCPTIIIYQLKTKLRDDTIENAEYSKYVTDKLINEWKSAWAIRVGRHERLKDWDMVEDTYRAQLRLIGRLNERGVLMLAGSDFGGMPYVYPGISLHQELKLMIDAGLSEGEALRTATLNPAIFMEMEDRLGTVEVGKFADLIILDKNPLRKIENLKKIHCVVLKGCVINQD